MEPMMTLTTKISVTRHTIITMRDLDDGNNENDYNHIDENDDTNDDIRNENDDDNDDKSNQNNDVNDDDNDDKNIENNDDNDDNNTNLHAMGLSWRKESLEGVLVVTDVSSS